MIQYECNAIIFDLEGTLINSRGSVERQWTYWAKKHMLDPDEILAIIHGRPAIQTMRIIAPYLQVEHEAAQLAEAEAADLEGVVALDGAIELLDALPSNAWGIATSSTYAIAGKRLQYAGLPIPDCFVTADQVESGKPAPDPFLIAAQRLKVPQRECIAVEDTPIGIEAAHAAGMKVIAITTTHPRYKLPTADLIIDSLEEIQVIEAEYLVESRLILRI